MRTAAIMGLCATHYSMETVGACGAVPLHQGFLDLLREGPFFVGRVKNQIVACGFLDAAAARVEGMFVMPTFARQGIGRSVLQRIEEVARGRGLQRLNLDSTFNAAPFYERQGYVRLGAGNWRHPAGFDIGCIHMQKELSA